VLTGYACSTAYSLGLFISDEDDGRTDLANVIQKFNRWLITTYSDEDFADLKPRHRHRDRPPSPSPISKTTAMACQNVIICGSCGMSSSRDVVVHAIDMLYTSKVCAVLSAVL
jgi:hypothetical protein